MTWEEDGRMFGYPECCIQDFVHRVRTLAMSREVTSPRRGEWTGSGFIPCKLCARDIDHLGLKPFVEARIAPRRVIATPFTYPKVTKVELRRQHMAEDAARENFYKGGK